MKHKGLFIKAITFVLAIVTFASVLVGCAQNADNADDTAQEAPESVTLVKSTDAQTAVNNE